MSTEKCYLQFVVAYRAPLFSSQYLLILIRTLKTCKWRGSHHLFSLFKPCLFYFFLFLLWCLQTPVEGGNPCLIKRLWGRHCLPGWQDYFKTQTWFKWGDSNAGQQISESQNEKEHKRQLPKPNSFSSQFAEGPTNGL